MTQDARQTRAASVQVMADVDAGTGEGAADALVGLFLRAPAHRGGLPGSSVAVADAWFGWLMFVVVRAGVALGVLEIRLPAGPRQ